MIPQVIRDAIQMETYDVSLYDGPITLPHILHALKEKARKTSMERNYDFRELNDFYTHYEQRYLKLIDLWDLTETLEGQDEPLMKYLASILL